MRRITITLPDEVADLLREEAQRRRTSMSAVARELLTEGLVESEARPREIPWAGIIDAPEIPPARVLEEVLEREWPDAMDRDLR